MSTGAPCPLLFTTRHALAIDDAIRDGITQLPGVFP
jgi:hypothetical protein